MKKTLKIRSSLEPFFGPENVAVGSTNSTTCTARLFAATIDKVRNSNFKRETLRILGCTREIWYFCSKLKSNEKAKKGEKRENQEFSTFESREKRSWSTGISPPRSAIFRSAIQRFCPERHDEYEGINVSSKQRSLGATNWISINPSIEINLPSKKKIKASRNTRRRLRKIECFWTVRN